MLRKFIVFDGPAEVTCGQKHCGMFAGAVVVQRRRLKAGFEECALIVDVERKLWPACQFTGGEAGSFQPLAHDCDVAGRADMGRASECKFAVPHRVSVSGTGPDQREGPNELDR